MSRLIIPRRTVLRGAGGAALALPALNIMRDARAATTVKAPKRFLICELPLSTGERNHYQNTPPDMTTPTRTGKNYEITAGLRAIKKYGVQGDMGLVSGLMIPWVKNFELGRI